MTPVIKKTWAALQSAYNQISGGQDISFHEEAYPQFEEKFMYYYNLVLKQFMTEDTKELDEHKQASVIIISAIESNVIQQTVQADEIPLATYAIALQVGLSFLLDRINDKLKIVGEDPIKEFELPFPLACNTPYFESLCRMLYYEDSKIEKHGIDYPMTFNIVDWSDRFFLLEYILLQKNKVNPWVLRGNPGRL